MTRAEKRKARKLARGEGRPLTGDLAVGPAVEFTEAPSGYRGRDRWARRYDALNGAPEGDWDR